ncbi:MAG TPA: hypothetical protein EYH54_01480 [Nautiliaceae bacterium]|nr:hypothetical protein [Nautiliaceae bacterium]
MKILEKPFCDETFVYVKTLEDIKKTSNNATLIFEYCDSSLEVYNFCKINNIPYGVKVNNIKEMIFCTNLNTKYIFCDTIKKAKIFQKIVDEYLIDTQIVLLVNDFENIEEIVKNRIDAIKIRRKNEKTISYTYPK